MPKSQPTVDAVLRALADPTRRSIVERVGAGPATTSELARPFAMSLPSFTQHLGVLEDAGLVSSTKTGRVRIYRLEPAALETLGGWLAEQRCVWDERLDRLDAFVLSIKDKEQK